MFLLSHLLPPRPGLAKRWPRMRAAQQGHGLATDAPIPGEGIKRAIAIGQQHLAGDKAAAAAAFGQDGQGVFEGGRLEQPGGIGLVRRPQIAGLAQTAPIGDPDHRRCHGQIPGAIGGSQGRTGHHPERRRRGLRGGAQLGAESQQPDHIASDQFRGQQDRGSGRRGRRPPSREGDRSQRGEADHAAMLRSMTRRRPRTSSRSASSVTSCRCAAFWARSLARSIAPLRSSAKPGRSSWRPRRGWCGWSRRPAAAPHRPGRRRRAARPR